MLLADVIGTAVAEKTTSFITADQPVFLIVEEVTPEGEASGNTMIALDIIGANKGERVLISQGSSARQNEVTKDKPVDAVIAGIVDIVVKNDKQVYHKYEA